MSDRGEQEQDQLDRPRLLSRHSQFGYTDRAALALTSEPEAVPASYQQLLSDQATRNERQLQRAAWRVARAGIIESVTTFQASGRLDKGVCSALRPIQRTVAQVDQRVAAE